MIPVEDPRDLIARRIIAAECFLLALYVAMEGWTTIATLRLVQIAAAEESRRNPAYSASRLR
ncbi:MAG TPA: hypothetical protein VFZ00_11340 [Solirubrobacter sp.]|nr:hypothetical protein [Solirubrobacter sp.]